MNRHRWAVALLALLFLLCAGCGEGATGARAALGAGPWTNWIDDAARVLQRGTGEGVVAGRSIAREDAPLGATAGDLDRLVRSAPTTPDPQVQELILVAKRRQFGFGVVADARTRYRTTSADVSSLAAVSTDDPQVESALQTIGQDAVKDMACGALLDQLSPDEDAEAQQAGTGAWESYGKPTAQAAITYTARRLAPWAGATVAWTFWGAGLAENADRIAAGGQRLASDPDLGYTRAFYYYVATCQKWPNR